MPYLGLCEVCAATPEFSNSERAYAILSNRAFVLSSQRFLMVTSNASRCVIYQYRGNGLQLPTLAPYLLCTLVRPAQRDARLMIQHIDLFAIVLTESSPFDALFERCGSAGACSRVSPIEQMSFSSTPGSSPSLAPSRMIVYFYAR
jgi:hypothetical protein